MPGNRRAMRGGGVQMPMGLPREGGGEEFQENNRGLEGWFEIRDYGARKAAYWLLFVALLDATVCVLLLEATNDWGTTIYKPDQFFRNFFAFKESTSDVVVLMGARLFVLAVITLAAFKGARTQEKLDAESKKKEDEPRQKAQAEGINAPLLSNVAGYDLEDGITTQPPKDAKTLQAEKEADLLSKLNRQDRRKFLFLGSSFVLLTAFQVHAGIKCVSFLFGKDKPDLAFLQAVLMGLPVLWINLQQFIIGNMVEWLTIGEGYLWKDVHPHRMYFANLHCHWCDMCREKIQNGFRCRTCDFDMCMACFKKKNHSSAEGVLRGDSGTRDLAELTTWMYVKRAFGLAAPHCVDKLLLACAFFCLLCTSGASLFLPNYQGSILNQVIPPFNKEGFYRDIELYLLLSIGVGLFGGIRGLCFNIVGRRMRNWLQIRLFKSIINQDIAFYDGSSTGQLTSRLTNDINQMVSPMQSMLTTLLNNGILLIGGLVMCFYTSWRLSMLAFTTIGPIVYLTNTYAKWSRGIYRDILAAQGDANSSATQAIGNIRTVRAFSAEPAEIARYDDAMDVALSKGIRDAVVGAGTFALTNYLDLGTGVLVLWYGGTVVMAPDSTIEVGNLITFQLYWNMINSSYQALQGVLSSFTQAAGAAQRVLSIMDNTPDISSEGGQLVDRDVVKGEIKLENVQFSYQMRPDNMVLKGINLTVGAGQTVALVGKSGGGKSTLVHLLMRFYDPKQGRILLDGVDLRDLNVLSLHQIMGLVQQDTQLFNLTIQENISYGTEGATLFDVQEAARMANCHDFIMGFEDQYQTRVGERGVRLSGGQKQRISIARVFLRKPRLLFLDEATSALDTESEAAVQGALDILMKSAGCTVVLVAHRLSTVVNADKIAVVMDGEIAEQGSHEELVALEGHYFKLVSRQISRQKNKIEHDGNNAKELDTIDGLESDQKEDPDAADVIDKLAKD